MRDHETRLRPALLAMVPAWLLAAACGGTGEASPDAEDPDPDTGVDETSEVMPDDVSYEPVQDPLDADADGALPDGLDVAPDLAPDSAPDGPDEPWPDDSAITVDEVYRRFTAGDPDMLLLNVVDEEFYDLGHIPGSLVIPWDLLSGHLDMVDPARHIVIYCRRGVRSESAYVTLHDAGYPLLWIMAGGLETWIAAGYPTVPCEDVSVACL